MKCINCGYELNPKNKFCGQCGTSLASEEQNAANYLEEMQKIAQDQKKEQTDDKGIEALTTPMDLLQAQVRHLAILQSRVKNLEGAQQRVRIVKVIDFDMPFWSLVGFEFKVFLVSMFYMVIFFCSLLLLFSLVLKDMTTPLIRQIFSL